MKLTLPLERSLPKLLDRLSDTEYTKKKRTRQIIFQDPLVRSSSSNLSPQKRRERKWRKEACKLLPNYLGLLADKRGHCFRDPVRISVSQRDDKMSQFQPALARIKLPSFRGTKPGRALTPDTDEPADQRPFGGKLPKSAWQRDRSRWPIREPIIRLLSPCGGLAAQADVAEISNPFPWLSPVHGWKGESATHVR